MLHRQPLGEGERLAAEEYVGGMRSGLAPGTVIEVAVGRLGDRRHLALEYPAVVIMQVVDVETLLLERHQRGFDLLPPMSPHLNGHDQPGVGESSGDLWRDHRFGALDVNLDE